MKKKLLAIGLAIALIAFALLLWQFGGSKTKIAILYTGDVHCAVDENIGYAGLAAMKGDLQSDGYEVLLVDTGDATQGAPIGLLTKGDSLIDIMNELGYCAMTVGNHEFDYGMETALTLPERASFPILSCNFENIETGETVFDAYTIVEAAGVRIAFVGVTTPHTITSSTPRYFMNEQGDFVYGFHQDETGAALWTSVQRAVDSARAEGAVYVIALTHLGSGEEYSRYSSERLIASTTGIDIVLDGHAHVAIEGSRMRNAEGKEVLLSSSGTKLQYAGCLTIDRNGRISTKLLSDYTAKDETVAGYIASIQSDFAELLDTVVVTTGYDLFISDPATGERRVRKAETNMGDLVADAFRAAGGADIAVVNSGGIRVDIAAGAVTNGDLLTVLPFGNQLCVVRATGRQILDALEFGASRLPEEFGGFLQVSGLTYEIHTYLPSTVRTDDAGMFTGVEGEYRVKNVLVGGEPLDTAGQYTVAVLGYTAKDKGDGNTAFLGAEILFDDFIQDYDAFSQYVDEYYPELIDAYADPYGEGRIAIVSTAQ